MRYATFWANQTNKRNKESRKLNNAYLNILAHEFKYDLNILVQSKRIENTKTKQNKTKQYKTKQTDIKVCT